MHEQLPDAASAVHIRAATKGDVDAIADLWVELMAYHEALDARFRVPANGRTHYQRHISQALRDNNYRVVVAIVGTRPIGYVLGYVAQNPPIFPNPRYGFIADISINHAYRRHGVGEQLVTSICQWFRTHGLRSVQLNVAHHNAVSQAFWRKIGCSDYLDHMWLNLDGE